MLPVPDTAPPKLRDQVVIALAGARIELTGAHAERIVRFVLGQLGGGRCRSPAMCEPSFAATRSTCASPSTACHIWCSRCWHRTRCYVARPSM
ncbi:hypothetical protein D8I24_0481 (plasmid) [Cupriavidus necator H850]|nr:hypothetical protein D8I24_0481 [Cupriavidus necator H850]